MNLLFVFCCDSSRRRFEFWQSGFLNVSDFSLLRILKIKHHWKDVGNKPIYIFIYLYMPIYSASNNIILYFNFFLKFFQNVANFRIELLPLRIVFIIGYVLRMYSQQTQPSERPLFDDQKSILVSSHLIIISRWLSEGISMWSECCQTDF